MAQNRIELVISAEDAKAANAFTKLIEQARSAGSEVSKIADKQKSTFDEIGGGILKMVGPIATVSGAAKALMDVFDHIREKIEAVRAAQFKAAEQSKSYGEALGRVAVNIPGITVPQAQGIDQMLRSVASQRGLGEGGLVKLADAYAQIQSAIPLAPEAKKSEALQETAKLLEMVPTENAPAIALGVAKVMEASDWALSGTQAMNLLRQQQTLGLVKDIGPIGQGIPSLGAAAKLGGTSLPQMQALAAYMTQVAGDTGGEETITAIKSMVAQVMTRGGDIEKTINAGRVDEFGQPAEPIRIQGDFFKRLDTIRDLYQQGQFTEQMLGDLFPIISRGGGGKIAIFDLLNQGRDKLRQYTDIMQSPATMQGDLTAEDMAVLQQAAPAQFYQQQRRLLQSKGEARRAADAPAAEAILAVEEFEARMGKERQTERYRRAARVAFDASSVGFDMSPGVAGAIGRVYGTMSDRPGIGTSYGKIPLDPQNAALDTLKQVLVEIRDAIQNAKAVPRRSLPTGADR